MKIQIANTDGDNPNIERKYGGLPAGVGIFSNVSAAERAVKLVALLPPTRVAIDRTPRLSQLTTQTLL